MDFITELPKVRGYSVIVTVVDRLSKFCHLGSLPTNYTTVSVANFFIKNVVKIHGFLKSIITERDKVFVSQFWKELMAKSGTTLKFLTSYHPGTWKIRDSEQNDRDLS